ncbi:hypothetical protein [Chitinophaga nivalis]|uniref:Uncharacterized protein n=1 Tax=Chitinophaga nivalis TaxID=2991709 RepID=A0ABT3IRR1_9BACT|nr:hypothetical protein [Chitinophaga nivalis]MCW3463664.1 hypothetical protein [Chitinophaga nivalis]MCW3486646.1 hypothetical protein [Chitinophaga nivalis]
MKHSTLLTWLLLIAGGEVIAAGRAEMIRPDTSGNCYSAVTEVSVNPYVYSIAGNWRLSRSYAYYGSRSESAAITTTDIRKNGTLSAYASFWSQTNGVWKPSTDTTRWVWNAESTLFNSKGFEIENRDPLGRYNAGLYGYDHVLPVAVIQNSRYRESYYDGFEDYNFGKNVCDPACAVGRGFGYTKYAASITTAAAHTGKYSLWIDKGTSADVSASLVSKDEKQVILNVPTVNNNCPPQPAFTLLRGIMADSTILLPTFSPLNNTRLLISGWVKEEQNCNCISYTKSSIVITAGSTTSTAAPVGYIIDGWQRYEAVINVPATGSLLKISLRASGDTPVFFDDIRIHPFNANMKSFVYDPVFLRLMAELDENNYATFYEYDDDGTLIRLKKETERGIKTIRETRSALIKD